MSLAKDINKLLDDMLAIKAEIRRIDLEITPEQTLKNVQTGERVNKEEVLEFVQGEIKRIEWELNKITNDGKNVKDIFTNKFYINDSMQDREIIAKENEPNNIAPKSLKPKKPKANKKKLNKDGLEQWKKYMLEQDDLEDNLPF
jgi:hypothetical protein